MKFGIARLTWGRDVTVEDISTIQRAELINKHEFVKVTLNKMLQILIIHVVLLKNNGVYLSKTSLIVALSQNKVSIAVSRKYTNYANIFLANLALELLD